MFNGAPDRYDWKLVGKQRDLRPVQQLPAAGPEAEVQGHPHAAAHQPRAPALRAAPGLGGRRDAAGRASATSTSGASSTSTRTAGRSCVVDQYDNRDQLWRVSEGHAMNFYNVPTHLDRRRGAHRPAGRPLPRDGALQREPAARLQPEAHRGRLHARRAARGGRALNVPCSASPRATRTSVLAGRGGAGADAVPRPGGGGRAAPAKPANTRPRRRLAASSLLLDAAVRGGLVVAVGERGHILVSTRPRASPGARPRCRPAPCSPASSCTTSVSAGPSATTRSSCARATAARRWERVHYAPEARAAAARRLVRRRRARPRRRRLRRAARHRDGGDTWTASDRARRRRLPPEPDRRRGRRHALPRRRGRPPLPVGRRRRDAGSALPSPYDGLVLRPAAARRTASLLAFGLRGHLFRSPDGGRTWTPIATGTEATLTWRRSSSASGASSSAGMAGTLLWSDDGGRSVRKQELPDRKAIVALRAGGPEARCCCSARAACGASRCRR